ncbi:MAG: Ig-like domain-containing protein, partial [Gemmatimonadota bacterium]|nr:Ig-like domain-containing protein [Gemmatimonadota bacterium]
AVSIAPSVFVTDADANAVAGVPVAFAVASGGGQLTGASTTTNAAGIASLGTWTLGAAGANTLTATAANIASPVTFTATANALPILTTLQVTAAPASLQVGQTSQVTATGRDQYGAAIAAGPIVWSSSPQASVTPFGVVTALSAGQATITATAATISAQTVISITALPASRLAISSAVPAVVANRAPLTTQPVLQLVDANGAAVAQAGVVVQASLTGVGALAGTTTATTNASGAASFSGLEVRGAAGAKTLTFTATGYPAVALNFTLVAGAASNIAINSGANQTATAGTVLPVLLSVAVTDADANPVSNAPVNFAVASGVGALTGANTITNAMGVATLGSWTLGLVGTNSVVATVANTTVTTTFTAVATAPANVPMLTSLVFAINGVPLQVGGTAQASVTGRDQTGAVIATGPVVWTATGAATISQAGVITGVSAGTATITATAGAVSTQATITVNAAPPPPSNTPVLTSLQVTLTPNTINIGETSQVTVTGLDQYGAPIATGPVTYTLPNTFNNTVSITSTGVVSANHEGSDNTVIVAHAGAVTGQAILRVKILTTLKVSVAPSTILVGETAQATIVALDQFGNPYELPIVFSQYCQLGCSSNNGSVTITADKKVTGTREGPVVLRAMGPFYRAATYGLTADAVLTVRVPKHLVNITLSAPLSINAGQTAHVTVQGFDQDGASFPPGQLQYYADPPRVGTINQFGDFVGVNPGVFVLTVQAITETGTIVRFLNITVNGAPTAVLSVVTPPPASPVSNQALISPQPRVQIVDKTTGQPLSVQKVAVTAALLGGGTLSGTTTMNTDVG